VRAFSHHAERASCISRSLVREKHSRSDWFTYVPSQARTTQPGCGWPCLMRAQLACLVDGASATWLEETAIGFTEGCVWMQLLYVMCPRDPGPVKTADFHVSLEPDCGATFARDGPRPVASGPNQTSAPCMRRAWFRSAQATNHLLDFSAPPGPS
jgi:hypothetical protein